MSTNKLAGTHTHRKVLDANTGNLQRFNRHLRLRFFRLCGRATATLGPTAALGLTTTLGLYTKNSRSTVPVSFRLLLPLQPPHLLCLGAVAEAVGALRLGPRGAWAIPLLLHLGGGWMIFALCMS